jgi:deoxyadenosine/deoxycytidine kinase
MVVEYEFIFPDPESNETLVFDLNFIGNISTLINEPSQETIDGLMTDSSIPDTDKFVLYTLFKTIKSVQSFDLKTDQTDIIVVEGTSGVGKSTALRHGGEDHLIITDDLLKNPFLKFTKTDSIDIKELSLRNQLLFRLLKLKDIVDAINRGEKRQILVDSWFLTEDAHINLFSKQGLLDSQGSHILSQLKFEEKLKSKINSKIFLLTAHSEVVKCRILNRNRGYETIEEGLKFQMLLADEMSSLSEERNIMIVDTSNLSPKEVFAVITS